MLHDFFVVFPHEVLSKVKRILKKNYMLMRNFKMFLNVLRSLCFYRVWVSLLYQQNCSLFSQYLFGTCTAQLWYILYWPSHHYFRVFLPLLVDCFVPGWYWGGAITQHSQHSQYILFLCGRKECRNLIWSAKYHLGQFSGGL